MCIKNQFHLIQLNIQKIKLKIVVIFLKHLQSFSIIISNKGIQLKFIFLFLNHLFKNQELIF